VVLIRSWKDLYSEGFRGLLGCCRGLFEGPVL